MAWYNTYRPTSFDDVIGQQLVKDILTKSLEKNVIKHAYLFSGPKGIGKTTLARIFAGELNQVNANPEAKLDIIEMDAASNTGIDDIRQLLESAKSEPLSAPYKIYIIDEVHMLSKPAMNALLKILEEPPEYIIFLLATTNPEKLIPTVLSRLTKLPLQAHTIKDITGRLAHIASEEQIQIDEEALELIAKRSEGSQRDAINLLETVSAYSLDSYSADQVAELLGLLPTEILQRASSSLALGIKPEDVQELSKLSVDGTTFLSQLLDYAIEESFAGQTKYDTLIIPIAETLGLGLPYTSITSALALVAQKISPASSSVSTLLARPAQPPTPEPAKPSKRTPTKPAEIKTEPSPSLDTPRPPQDTQNQNSKSGNDAKPIEPKVVTRNTNTLSGTHQVVSKLQQDASCPPILKMIIPDLHVLDGTENELILSVTNGIFSAQLESSKLQTYLKDHLQKHTGSRFSFKVQQRQKDSSISIEDMLPPQEAQPETPTEQTVEPHLTTDKQTTPSISTADTSQKIFYKVFKELPKEMKENELPVYAQPIPEPEKSSSRDEWSEVEDMFELE